MGLLIWMDKLRGMFVQQNGTQLPGTGRVNGLNFTDLDVSYDAVTGIVTIGPPSGGTKGVVGAATTAALPTNTLALNVLTASANAALAAQDGVAMSLGARLLVKNEASALKNGIYVVTDLGSGSTPWKLTRAVDADATSEFASGAVVPVLAGALNGGQRFVLTVSGTFALNTDAVTYTVLSAASIYDVHAYGAVGDGVTNDTAAIAAAIAACAAGGSGIVKFRASEYCYTALSVVDNNVVLEGTGDMGDTGTVLMKTSTTGDGVSVNAQNSGLRNIFLRNLPTSAAPTAGYAAHFTGCFCPLLENVRISDSFNGVKFESCTEIRIQGTLWLRNLFGPEGLNVDGVSGFAQRIIADNPYPLSPDGHSHAARIPSHTYAAGDTYTSNGLIFQVTTGGAASAGAGPTTVPGTTVANAHTTVVTDGAAQVKFVGANNVWLLGGPNVGGFTVQSCALLNGGTAFKQNGGNWWFFEHFEFDHQWNKAIWLELGSGFRSSNTCWLSSVFTSNGVYVGPSYTGDVHMTGGRIFATFDHAILLQSGPVDCYFEGQEIDTGTGVTTFGFCAGASAGVGPKHWSFKPKRVKNYTYGAVVLASDADYYEISGDLSGNVTAEISDGGTGVHTKVQARALITDVRDLGGYESSGLDCAPAFQLKLNQLKRGENYKCPAGKFTINTALTVPPGCGFEGQYRGAGIGPFEFNDGKDQTGTMLLVTYTGVAITGGQQSRIRNLEAFWPNQNMNAAPTAYDYFIDFPVNCHFGTVENVVAVNPYKFLRVNGNGFTGRNLTGFPLRRGITLGRVADVARLQFHFIPTAHYNFGATLLANVQANAQAILIDGAEQFDLTDCFAYGYDDGIQFRDEDADGFRGVYGSMKGGGFDQCNRCIRVLESCPLTAMGLTLSDVHLIATTSGHAIEFTDTHVPVTPQQRPAIHATSVSVHGASDRVIVLATGSYGVVTVTGGYWEGFSNAAAFAQSASSFIHLDHVAMPTPGVARSAGGGTIVDNSPISL